MIRGLNHRLFGYFDAGRRQGFNGEGWAYDTGRVFNLFNMTGLVVGRLLVWGVVSGSGIAQGRQFALLRGRLWGRGNLRQLCSC